MSRTDPGRTLLIGNPFNEHLIGDLEAFPPAKRRLGGNSSLRMAWLARPGDVVVVAQPADPAFLRYLFGLKGLAPDDVTVLVPPPGRFGTDVLTRDRLLHPDFVKRAGQLVGSNGIERVLPFSFEPAVAALALRLGLERGTPGLGFLAGSGHDLLNAKSAFRSIAEGLGLPLPDGVVTRVRDDAETFASGLLASGKPAIVKQDFHAGAHGNEILAPRPGISQVGAPLMSVLGSPGAVRSHFDRHWQRYSNGGRNYTVVEEYLEDSVPLGSEFAIDDSGVTERHGCEMRMAPVFDGIAIPGLTTSDAVRRQFLDAAARLCEPVRAMGYRGLINIDGLAAPDGRVVLSEYNGRLGGTTHLHWFGENLVGPGYLAERVLVSRNKWRVPSFSAAVRVLERSGLAFDPAERAGVVIACDHVRQGGAVEFCIIARDRDEALRWEKQLSESFPAQQ
ncbi:peptide ligase PGM1-related protein [Streptomyces sp. NPDC007991]|uniref:preATP grasp domain-containing protein n=1 Tax=Streptomyces sp. NPDC007991 TaxID=3364803 RepID=UPI0036E39C5D